MSPDFPLQVFFVFVIFLQFGVNVYGVADIFVRLIEYETFGRQWNHDTCDSTSWISKAFVKPPCDVIFKFCLDHVHGYAVYYKSEM